MSTWAATPSNEDPVRAAPPALPGHRRNLLGPFDVCGIGWAASDSGADTHARHRGRACAPCMPRVASSRLSAVPFGDECASSFVAHLLPRPTRGQRLVSQPRRCLGGLLNRFVGNLSIWGNHLSHATCLTHGFFNSGESCCNV